jgi:hypothetical protein
VADPEKFLTGGILFEWGHFFYEFAKFKYFFFKIYINTKGIQKFEWRLYLGPPIYQYQE